MLRLFLPAVLVCCQTVAFAQPPAAAVRQVKHGEEKTTVAQLPTPAPVTPVTGQEKPPEISIAIEASRAQPTVGGSFSLLATVKNLGAKPITFTGMKTTLFIPPEISGSEDPSLCTFYGYFTTEAGEPNFTYAYPVTIQPEDVYTVAWTLGTPTTMTTPNPAATPGTQPRPPGVIHGMIERIKSEMQFVFFTPGDYKATVALRYHVDGDPDTVLRSVSQSALVHVAAPQSVILSGAAAGGLLGYIITLLFLTKKTPQSEEKETAAKSTHMPQWLNEIIRVAVKLSKFIAGVIGSVLLSAIVTILLSRLSETQFLIRVSINDFWGAIAIGFVANLTGIKILSKIVASGDGPDGNRDGSTRKKTPATEEGRSATQ